MSHSPSEPLASKELSEDMTYTIDGDGIYEDATVDDLHKEIARLRLEAATWKGDAQNFLNSATYWRKQAEEARRAAPEPPVPPVPPEVVALEEQADRAEMKALREFLRSVIEYDRYTHDEIPFEDVVKSIEQDAQKVDASLRRSVHELDHVRGVRRPASSQPPGREWQPIETARKDGKAFLVFCPERANTYMVYRKEAFYGDKFMLWATFEQELTQEATHWMELPPNPTSPKVSTP